MSDFTDLFETTLKELAFENNSVATILIQTLRNASSTEAKIAIIHDLQQVASNVLHLDDEIGHLPTETK